MAAPSSSGANPLLTPASSAAKSSDSKSKRGLFPINNVIAFFTIFSFTLGLASLIIGIILSKKIIVLGAVLICLALILAAVLNHRIINERKEEEKKRLITEQIKKEDEVLNYIEQIITNDSRGQSLDNDKKNTIESYYNDASFSNNLVFELKINNNKINITDISKDRCDPWLKAKNKNNKKYI